MRVRPKGTSTELQEKLEQIGKISSKVLDHYERMRATFPFPLEPMEVYDAAISKKLRDMVWREVVPPDASSERWATEINLRSLMSMGMQVTMSLDPEQRMFDSIHGTTHLRRVFWMKLPRPVPVPVGRTVSVLLVPELSRHRHVLGEWFFKAAKFASAADKDMKLIRAVIKKSRLPEVLEKVWPELMNYARLGTASAFDADNFLISNSPDEELREYIGKRASGAFAGGSIKQQVNVVWEEYGPKIEAQRARIAHTIATASLVPVTDPVAWIGWGGSVAATQ